MAFESLNKNHKCYILFWFGFGSFRFWLSNILSPLGLRSLVLTFGTTFHTIENRFRIGQSIKRETKKKCFFFFFHILLWLFYHHWWYFLMRLIDFNNNKKPQREKNERTKNVRPDTFVWPMWFVEFRLKKYRWYNFDKTRHRCSIRQ